MASTGPLSGLRIIEMDAIGPVPHCGMILSDLGAEIIRITRPGGHSAYENVGQAILHRGRQNIEIDLKSEAGSDAVLALCERADALIEGARPGVMERLGLGPDVCLKRAPHLVFARATGWGQTGAMRTLAGHDINYIAMTGALHAMSDADGMPPVPLNLIGDYGGGSLYLALGAVCAILNAQRTGAGQVVDAAIVDGVASLSALLPALIAGGHWREQPRANLLDGGAPFYRCYVCSDGGHVGVGALEPQFFALLIEGLGIAPTRFAQYDRTCWPAMERELAARFASRPRDHWTQVFEGSDACVTPVLSFTEAMAHPVAEERAAYSSANGVTQPAPAPRFSQTPARIGESRDIDLETALALWPERAGI